MRRHMMEGVKEKAEKSTMPEPHHSGKEVGPESSPSKPAAIKKVQSDMTRPNIGKAVSHLEKMGKAEHWNHKK